MATKTASPATTANGPSAVMTEDERKHREQLLLQCFNEVDLDHNGFLDREELKIVARAFNPNGDVDEEVKTIVSRLDKNRDDLIDKTEWNTFLVELFQFMNRDAFDKHCQELLNIIASTKAKSKSAA